MSKANYFPFPELVHYLTEDIKFNEIKLKSKTIKEARDELIKILNELKIADKKRGLTILVLQPGIGKTHYFRQLCEETMGKTIVLYSNNHSLLTEIEDDLKKKGIACNHPYGLPRGLCDVYPKSDEKGNIDPQETWGEPQKLIKKLYKAGTSPRYICPIFCSHEKQKNCKYHMRLNQKTVEGNINLVPLDFINTEYFNKYADVIFIDEECKKTTTHVWKYNRQKLEEWIDEVRKRIESYNRDNEESINLEEFDKTFSELVSLFDSYDQKVQENFSVLCNDKKFADFQTLSRYEELRDNSRELYKKGKKLRNKECEELKVLEKEFDRADTSKRPMLLNKEKVITFTTDGVLQNPDFKALYGKHSKLNESIKDNINSPIKKIIFNTIKKSEAEISKREKVKFLKKYYPIMSLYDYISYSFHSPQFICEEIKELTKLEKENWELDKNKKCGVAFHKFEKTCHTYRIDNDRTYIGSNGNEDKENKACFLAQYRPFVFKVFRLSNDKPVVLMDSSFSETLFKAHLFDYMNERQRYVPKENAKEIYEAYQNIKPLDLYYRSKYHSTMFTSKVFEDSESFLNDILSHENNYSIDLITSSVTNKKSKLEILHLPHTSGKKGHLTKRSRHYRRLLDGEIIGLITAILGKENCYFVTFKDAIEENAKRNYLMKENTLPYFVLRGKNDLNVPERKAYRFVIGTPYPDIYKFGFDLVRNFGIGFSDEKIKYDEKGDRHYYYENKLEQEVLESNREENLYQSIHRFRPLEHTVNTNIIGGLIPEKVRKEISVVDDKKYLLSFVFEEGYKKLIAEGFAEKLVNWCIRDKGISFEELWKKIRRVDYPYDCSLVYNPRSYLVHLIHRMKTEHKMPLVVDSENGDFVRFELKAGRKRGKSVKREAQKDKLKAKVVSKLNEKQLTKTEYHTVFNEYSFSMRTEVLNELTTDKSIEIKAMSSGGAGRPSEVISLKKNVNDL